MGRRLRLRLAIRLLLEFLNNHWIGKTGVAMKITLRNRRSFRKREGFTLAEQIISMAVALIMISGIVSGFIQSTKQAEWSAYSLAAQSLANQCLEQTRAAKWDPSGYPAVDQLITNNFPVSVQVLDIPNTKSNVVYATNVITITTVSTSPALRMIRVDTTWPFINRGNFSNTIVSYRAPDQ